MEGWIPRRSSKVRVYPSRSLKVRPQVRLRRVRLRRVRLRRVRLRRVRLRRVRLRRAQPPQQLHRTLRRAPVRVLRVGHQELLRSKAP